jgi:hypothetical protein
MITMSSWSQRLLDAAIFFPDGARAGNAALPLAHVV